MGERVSYQLSIWHLSLALLTIISIKKREDCLCVLRKGNANDIRIQATNRKQIESSVTINALSVNVIIRSW